MGFGNNAKGIIAFAIMSKFAVMALEDLSSRRNGDMFVYVTVDTKMWAKTQCPHASSVQLRENAYTIIESTTHSLAIDVALQDQGPYSRSIVLTLGNIAKKEDKSRYVPLSSTGYQRKAYWFLTGSVATARAKAAELIELS